MATSTSSATSMNFIGFDELKGNGTAPLLFNRIVILPSLPETAGRHAHAVAGFLPGQQPFLKASRQVYNKKRDPLTEMMKMQGYKQYYGTAYY